MDARVMKTTDGSTFRHGSDEARRAGAVETAPAAQGWRLVSVFGAIGTFLGGIVQFLAIYPQRRAVFDQLNGLTDRELADIGLERADIARVFDADFTLPGRARLADRPVRVASNRLSAA